MGAASEVERVVGELGETPFEPLKEEQEEGVWLRRLWNIRLPL